MSSKRIIDNQLHLVTTLGDLMQTKEEVYVAKMLQIRSTVIKTRKFLEGLVELFNELRLTYRQQLEKQVKDISMREKQYLSVLKKNGLAVAVLLTGSEKPYGEVNQKIFTKFWDYIGKHPDIDVVVVGKLGKDMYINKNTDRPYRYFDLVEENVSLEDLGLLINQLVEYDEVRVFYGQFESFINQTGHMVTISGTAPLEITEHASALKEGKFLFEPSLKEILAFFETKIFGLVFRQLALESYLAQIGSRIVSLEFATSNIEDRIEDLKHDRRRWIKRRRNRKQLQSYVGLSRWM